MQTGIDMSILNNKKAFSMEKRKKNTVWKQKAIVTVFLVLFMCVGILLTPVFNVEKITVTGNNYLSVEKILETSTAKINKNIFLFSEKETEQKISELSFTDTVEVTRIFPSEVSIRIKECKPVAQIMCGQSLYLITDKNGKILDTSGDKEKYGVPTIEGLEITEFEVSKKVVFENSQMFEKLLVLVEEISKNNLLQKTNSVMLRDMELHAVFDGNIDCNFGMEDNLSYRVKFVKECLEKIPEGQGGEIRFMEDHKAVFTKK